MFTSTPNHIPLKSQLTTSYLSTNKHAHTRTKIAHTHIARACRYTNSVQIWASRPSLPQIHVVLGVVQPQSHLDGVALATPMENVFHAGWMTTMMMHAVFDTNVGRAAVCVWAAMERECERLQRRPLNYTKRHCGSLLCVCSTIATRNPRRTCCAGCGNFVGAPTKTTLRDDDVMSDVWRRRDE